MTSKETKLIRKEDIKSVLLTILFLALLFSFFYFLNVIQKMKQNQIVFAEFTSKIQMKEDFYRTNFELNFEMSGLKTPDIYCEDSPKERKFLSEMVKDKSFLIYRFTGNSCKTCYTDALTELQNELAESFGFDKIRALSSQLTKRDLLILTRTYNIQFPIYLIPPKSFDWVAEDYGNPYYFVLHPDMKISHIYVPNKSYPELNKQYLEGVKRFLSD